MNVAITRAVPASIARCELTFQTRVPIDLARARHQHAEYQSALVRHGYQVIDLPEAPDMPDSVFVEDVAVVFDECAIITRPGAKSRRDEVASIRTVLAGYREELRDIREPGTLDGGDVLQIGRRVFVGLSTRTNQSAVDQMRDMLSAFDYEVVGVEVSGSLHLKSVATAVADDLIVVDSSAIDPALFRTQYIEVSAEAANMLRLHDAILAPVAAAPFLPQLQIEGLSVELIDNSELAKAEGALTCCSLLFTSAS